MKDIKGIVESLGVAWATMAIIPGLDLLDFPIIFFIKGLLGVSYVQVAVVYYGIAVIVLIFLAPKKLKRIYNQIRKVI